MLLMPASGEQMYMLGDDHVILLARDDELVGQQRREPGDHRQRQQRHADHCRQRTGEGVHPESRPVGTALYIASQVYRQTEIVNKNGSISMRWEHGTQVSSFDVKTVEAKRPRHAVLQWLQ